MPVVQARGGYVTVGRIGRVPVRVHLATPLGFFVFTGFSFHPVLWALFLLIIVVHELGHAALVKRFRLSVLSIDVTGIGGACRWAGYATEVQDSVIAWGGILGQVALLVVTEMIGHTIGLHGETFLGQTAKSLVVANVALIVVNLLPIPPLDGAKAWALFRWRNLRSWGRRGVLKARAASIERELARLADDDEAIESSRRKYLN